MDIVLLSLLVRLTPLILFMICVGMFASTLYKEYKDSRKFTRKDR